MATFEHMAHGIGLTFQTDLEGVIGDSDKTKDLVATERPIIVQSKKPFEVIDVHNEQIPKGAVAYSAGLPVRADGVIYMPLTFYRRK
jgi:hypothetical protein